MQVSNCLVNIFPRPHHEKRPILSRYFRPWACSAVLCLLLSLKLADICWRFFENFGRLPGSKHVSRVYVTNEWNVITCVSQMRSFKRTTSVCLIGFYLLLSFVSTCYDLCRNSLHFICTLLFVCNLFRLTFISHSWMLFANIDQAILFSTGSWPVFLDNSVSAEQFVIVN